MMANLTESNLTNFPDKFSNSTVESETQNSPLNIHFIITIIINSITCPCTVLLNVLVTMAVKRRPRLQTNANILLACLAVTDALTGLASQPAFALWKTKQLLEFTKYDLIRSFHNASVLILSVCSCLHLTLVTCERLLTIKFTMLYHEIVTKRKTKVAVIASWIFSISCYVIERKKDKVADTLVALALISCILFIASTYAVLYLETRRHRNIIKTQQLPQEEVERFVKESKALKTTVYVVGAVALCFLPMGVTFLSYSMKWPLFLPTPWVRTFAMLNSFINPLIYCWRQKEMRKFVFRMQPRAVNPVN